MKLLAKHVLSEESPKGLTNPSKLNLKLFIKIKGYNPNWISKRMARMGQMCSKKSWSTISSQVVMYYVDANELQTIGSDIDERNITDPTILFLMTLHSL